MDLDAFLDRLAAFFIRHGVLLKDPESMVAAFIMTFWAVMAGGPGGWVAILILFGLGAALHVAAVESGNHVLLWIAMAWLLLLIVIASEVTFGRLPAWLLAAAGTSALGYSELIRINSLRRRMAIIHEEVYHASGLAVAGAGVVAVVGMAVAAGLDSGHDRNWLWVPLAAAALMVIGFGLAVGPARHRSAADRERWEPGERIPPQPLGREDLDQR